MIKSLCVAFVVLAQSGAVTKALKNVPRNVQSSGSQAELRGAPSLLLALACLQHCSLRIHAHSVGSYSRCMSIEWSSSVRAAKLLLRYGSSWRASLLLDRRRARWRRRLEPCHACRRRTKESVQLRAASDRHACRLQQCSTRMQPCLPAPAPSTIQIQPLHQRTWHAKRHHALHSRHHHHALHHVHPWHRHACTSGTAGWPVRYVHGRQALICAPPKASPCGS